MTFDMYMNWVMIVGINQEIEPMLIENSSHTQKISAKILIILKYASALASPSHPRQGVPPPAKRLSCGRQCYGLPFRYGHDSCLIVASAPLTPLRAAVPFACSHRLGGSTSCSSRQPHKPKLLPFAATVAHGRCQR